MIALAGGSGDGEGVPDVALGEVTPDEFHSLGEGQAMRDDSDDCLFSAGDLEKQVIKECFCLRLVPRVGGEAHEVCGQVRLRQKFSVSESGNVHEKQSGFRRGERTWKGVPDVALPPQWLIGE